MQLFESLQSKLGAQKVNNKLTILEQIERQARSETKNRHKVPNTMGNLIKAKPTFIETPQGVKSYRSFFGNPKSTGHVRGRHHYGGENTYPHVSPKVLDGVVGGGGRKIYPQRSIPYGKIIAMLIKRLLCRAGGNAPWHLPLLNPSM